MGLTIFEIINKNDNEITNKEQLTLYVSPQVKTIEIAAQAIICQSGGINGMNIDPDAGEDFE